MLNLVKKITNCVFRKKVMKRATLMELNRYVWIEK
jgi:hypothetical protein